MQTFFLPSIISLLFTLTLKQTLCHRHAPSKEGLARAGSWGELTRRGEAALPAPV